MADATDFRSFDWASLTEEDRITVNRRAGTVTVLRAIRPDQHHYRPETVAVPPLLLEAIYEDAHTSDLLEDDA